MCVFVHWHFTAKRLWKWCYTQTPLSQCKSGTLSRFKLICTNCMIWTTDFNAVGHMCCVIRLIETNPNALKHSIQNVVHMITIIQKRTNNKMGILKKKTVIKWTINITVNYSNKLICIIVLNHFHIYEAVCRWLNYC